MPRKKKTTKNWNCGATATGYCIKTMRLLTFPSRGSKIFTENNIPHSLYSPDLSACNFALLPTIKLTLMGASLHHSRWNPNGIAGGIWRLSGKWLLRCFRGVNKAHGRRVGPQRNYLNKKRWPNLSKLSFFFPPKNQTEKFPIPLHTPQSRPSFKSLNKTTTVFSFFFFFL